MRTAVVGHVEWVESIRVDHLPRSGEIAHGNLAWSLPAGGGAVAAVQLARLAGGCDFFTALGDDETGRRANDALSDLGLTLHVAWRDAATRRAVTLVEPDGERTITTIGDRLRPEAADPLPWGDLASVDAVYVCATDDGGLRAARSARVLTATPREGSTLRTAGVLLDALIGSGRDPAERYDRGWIDPEPRVVVRTEGPNGGTWETASGQTGRYDAAGRPNPGSGVEPDAYGCGDSFAGGLTFALGLGEALPDVLRIAARCGATCAAGSGPYQRQLTAAELPDH